MLSWGVVAGSAVHDREIVIAKKGERPIHTRPVLARADARFRQYEGTA